MKGIAINERFNYFTYSPVYKYGLYNKSQSYRAALRSCCNDTSDNMSLKARKLELVLKDVNHDLENEGFFKERLTLDIWTKLMSNLFQVS